MKFQRLFLLGLFFVFIHQSFPQEAPAAADSGSLLLRDSRFFARHWYQLPDGSSVAYKDVLSMVSQVPGNTSIMKQEKGWRIAQYILGGLSLASAGVIVTYYFADLPHANVVMPISYSAGILSGLYSFLSGMTANIKLQRSVDNYNLSIMGVPVK